MRFHSSEALTFGLELEFQIFNRSTGMLSPSGIEFFNQLEQSPDSERFSLEATLSTIELNTSVHHDADSMLEEVLRLTHTLQAIAEPKNLSIRGGGTQLSQFWNERIMTPTPRAKTLEQRFGFLPKRFSTYGMHVHIGVQTGDQAIELGNGLQALTPLFIALSAASPFLQMSDTGLCAVRPLEPVIYPHGGAMPKMRNWQEFETVADEIFSTELADCVKDIYWDVRPKPEFGTIEVRVFDTPLSIHKAVAIAALTRGCAALLLNKKLALPTQAPPLTAEKSSRFFACRDGLNATLFNPFTQQWLTARTWLDSLFDDILKESIHPADERHIRALKTHCTTQAQDCDIMRQIRKTTQLNDQEHSDDLAKYSRQLAQHLFKSLND